MLWKISSSSSFTAEVKGLKLKIWELITQKEALSAALANLRNMTEGTLADAKTRELLLKSTKGKLDHIESEISVTGPWGGSDYRHSLSQRSSEPADHPSNFRRSQSDLSM